MPADLKGRIMKHLLMAIDPGASGGFAWESNYGILVAAPMPAGMTATCDFIKRLAGDGINGAVVEKVGGYMPGNSGPAAATFAGHCGEIRAAMYCHNVAIVDEPTPQKWMKALGHGISQYLPDGYKTMTEAARAKARADAKRRNKNAIKEDMQRRYPHLRVTLATADALAILTYAIKNALATQAAT